MENFKEHVQEKCEEHFCETKKWGERERKKVVEKWHAEKCLWNLEDCKTKKLMTIITICSYVGRHICTHRVNIKETFQYINESI